MRACIEASNSARVTAACGPELARRSGRSRVSAANISSASASFGPGGPPGKSALFQANLRNLSRWAAGSRSSVERCGSMMNASSAAASANGAGGSSSASLSKKTSSSVASGAIHSAGAPTAPAIAPAAAAAAIAAPRSVALDGDCRSRARKPSGLYSQCQGSRL
jgi:hypothetical protein